jgi:hypothetical protein
MKKLLGIIVINLFLNSNAFGGWLSNSPSIFGVELESNISIYKQKYCLINHNYDNLGLDNFILTELSPRDTTGPNWSDWIFTNSKLPITEGCINPKVENDDFFNFHVKIFPKTKEIYEISAIYKKVYKYNGAELENNLFLQDLNNTTSDSVRLTVRSTECQNMAGKIFNVIVASQKKKGFKNEYNKSFNDTFKLGLIKGKKKYKKEILVSSSCSIRANNNNQISKKDLNYSWPFLVKVSIALEVFSTTERIKAEKKLLKEIARGNANPDINTKGLN